MTWNRDDTRIALGVGALIATILGTTCSTNGRFEDFNRRIDDLNQNFGQGFVRIESRIEGLDERLRSVENTLGKIDQRLLTIERVVLPGAEQPAE